MGTSCAGDIIEFTAVTTSVTISSKLVISGIITPLDQAALAALESAIKQMIESGLDPNQSVSSVTVISVDGVAVQRRLQQTNNFQGLEVDYEAEIEERCTDNCKSTNSVELAVGISSQITEIMTSQVQSGVTAGAGITVLSAEESEVKSVTSLQPGVENEVVTALGEAQPSNLEIKGFKAMLTGSFTGDFDVLVSSLDDTQIDEALSLYKIAITQELKSQGALPPGSSLVVTSINEEELVYEISAYSDSMSEAEANIGQIESQLDDSSAMTSITTSVILLSQTTSGQGVKDAIESSSLSSHTSSVVASLSVSDVVMTSGELVVENFVVSSFDPEQRAKAMTYFEGAITEELRGLLPDDAFISVTSISDGFVEYDISYYGGSIEDATSSINAIHASLGETLTLFDISGSITEKSDDLPELSAVIVSSNNEGPTVGLPLNTSEDYKAAIEHVLESQGVLPEGSTVTVIGIDGDGVAQYTITIQVDDDSSVDVNNQITSIENLLSYIEPTSMPSRSSGPSSLPSSIPSIFPSVSTEPSSWPSRSPSSIPSENPSVSDGPSSQPSSSPSSIPSENPSISSKPSSLPSSIPSNTPSENPSNSHWPSSMPSNKPSIQPSESPSISESPSSQPSEKPSASNWPSSMPSESPSSSPSYLPTESSMPSSSPTVSEYVVCNEK